MGDMDLAEKMIKGAKESGCKIAKFQTWKVSRLTAGEWDDGEGIFIRTQSCLTRNMNS